MEVLHEDLIPMLVSLVLGTLRGWPLAHRLAFGNLCAGLSVQHFGGSLAAPGWGDIIDWVRDHSRASSYFGALCLLTSAAI